MDASRCLSIRLRISNLNTIQGSDAILSFYTNDWEPFVCSTDISVAIGVSKVAVRTRGDGQWKKYTYQDVNFSITLSGLLKFDDTNFSGWEMINNQVGFLTLLCRVSFEDDQGNIMTVQGEVMVETTTLGISQGNLVKNDFQLQGTGSLLIFVGLVPCPTEITAITVNGQEASDGTINVTHTYTGEAYQIKYRINNTGDYVYALSDETLTIPGLAIGPNQSIEIIPVCANGYEGTGMTQTFQVTQGLTCSSVTTGITIYAPNAANFSGLAGGVVVTGGASSMYIVPTIEGSATQFGYGWEGGSQYFYLPAGSPIPINNLAPGAHTINIIPVCAFGPNNSPVWGVGMYVGFTLNVQPAQSPLAYNYENDPTGNSLSLYINGVLSVAASVSNASGNITAPAGAAIRVVLSSSNVGSRVGTLTITDNTTSAQLYNNSANSPFSMTYSFTANGDSFTITGIVSP